MSKDELTKLMMFETGLGKGIEDIKRAWGPKPHKDKDKGNDKEGKGRWRKKGDTVNELAAEEATLTTNAPWLSPCSQGSQLGQSQDGGMVNAAPFLSGFVDSPGHLPSGRPGITAERRNSRNGSVSAGA